MLAALYHQGRDTSLAESCWAAAIEQGYTPDKLAAWSGMLLALDKRDPQRAAAFAAGFTPFECSTDDRSFPMDLQDLYKLALITGDPKWFLNVGDNLRVDPSYSSNISNFKRQVDIASKVREDTPPPAKLAEGLKRSSFLLKADTSSVGWCKNDSWGTRVLEWAAMAYLKQDKQPPKHRIDIELDHYRNYYFSPSDKSRDVDIKIRFSISPKHAPTRRANSFDRVLTVGLANRREYRTPDHSASPDPVIMYASVMFGPSDDTYSRPNWQIRANGMASSQKLTVWESQGRKPSPLLVPTSIPYQPNPKRVHSLRFVRVGAQAEAFLDGRRIALVHVPEDLANPGFFLKIVGCDVNLLALTADTLKSPKNPS